MILQENGFVWVGPVYLSWYRVQTDVNNPIALTIHPLCVDVAFFIIVRVFYEL